MASRRGKGLYHGLAGIQEGDFAIYLDHRGRYRTDVITSARGQHNTLGSTRGEQTLEEAIQLAEAHSIRQGFHHSIVVVQSGDGYTQIGAVINGRYRKSGK